MRYNMLTGIFPAEKGAARQHLRTRRWTLVRLGCAWVLSKRLDVQAGLVVSCEDSRGALRAVIEIGGIRGVEIACQRPFYGNQRILPTGVIEEQPIADEPHGAALPRQVAGFAHGGKETDDKSLEFETVRIDVQKQLRTIVARCRNLVEEQQAGGVDSLVDLLECVAFHWLWLLATPGTKDG